MNKTYIEEILDGKKKFDARAYPTNIRGTIGIIDSKNMKLVGLAELVNVRIISSNEYKNWHLTGKYMNCDFLVDSSSNYYAYDFVNCRKICNPKEIIKNGRGWCYFEDSLLKDVYFSNQLFEL